VLWSSPSQKNIVARRMFCVCLSVLLYYIWLVVVKGSSVNYCFRIKSESKRMMVDANEAWIVLAERRPYYYASAAT